MARKKAIISDDLDHFYWHGIYLCTRTIYIGGVSESEDGVEEINHKMAARVIKSIHALDAINKEPINIILNSIGGDVYYGLSIYDALRSTRCKVNIKVYGSAMSMASIILQAGDKRLLSPHSVVMVHDGEDAFQGESKNMEKWAEEGKRLRNVTYKIYQSRIREKKPKITIAQIEELCKVDNIMTAIEAINLGLADDIMYTRNFIRRKK